MNQVNHTNLMHPKEVAILLGIQEKTLAQWRSSKAINLPYCKIGSLVRYREADVYGFINDSMTAMPSDEKKRPIL